MLNNYRFEVRGTFPSLNELIAADRANHYMGNKLKRQSQSVICLEIVRQLKGVRIDNPIVIHYRYFERNRKRDLDNVAGYFHKVLQDSLVEMKVIENDSPKYIVGFTDYFEVDRLNPRIEINIEEVRIHDSKSETLR